MYIKKQRFIKKTEKGKIMSANIKSPLTNEKEDRRIIKDFLLILDGTDTGSLIKHAEEAMNGMLVLNGTGPEPVFVGIPPRWEDNPCGVGGYTWTMSRLTYMVTLCKAYLLTKEQRYLDKVKPIWPTGVRRYPLLPSRMIMKAPVIITVSITGGCRSLDTAWYTLSPYFSA